MNRKKETNLEASEVLNAVKNRMYERLRTTEPYEDENGNIVDPLQPVLASWGNFLAKLSEVEEKQRLKSGDNGKVTPIPALPAIPKKL